MNSFARFLLLGLLFVGLMAAGCSSWKAPVTAINPEYVDAQELKLKIRELADQLLATMPNQSLTGLVAMPTSFVNQDNVQQSSPFGRLVGESLIYEFNQRGFPVREYRLPGYIDIIPQQGDFALLRKGLVNTVGEKWAALIIGTYYRTPDAVFVNARLVRAADGMVLRTGQLVLVNNELVAQLTTATATPAATATGTGTAQPVAPKPLMSSGTMTIKPAPWSGASSSKKYSQGSRARSAK